MEMGVERAKQDVGDVEGSERSIREKELELVTVAFAPARRIEAQKERDHEVATGTARD
jgi:hypothetical protein